MAKPKEYRVYFKIRCYLGGVYSYTTGHVSVLADSEDEAKQKVRKDIQFHYVGPDKVELLKDFNK